MLCLCSSDRAYFASRGSVILSSYIIISSSYIIISSSSISLQWHIKILLPLPHYKNIIGGYNPSQGGFREGTFAKNPKGRPILGREKVWKRGVLREERHMKTSDLRFASGAAGVPGIDITAGRSDPDFTRAGARMTVVCTRQTPSNNSPSPTAC